MKRVRVIARLDVKGPNVIKGVNFECLRVVGKPNQMAEHYYRQGADELIYLDTVASLYGRQNLLNIVNAASDNIFIPFTVGGGVRSIDDMRAFLRAGADKVAINTAATKNPSLIEEGAKIFGSQCIVLSIEAKKIHDNKWEAYRDNGREPTGLDVVEWAKKGEELGAGEILITSVDQDGTEMGFDLELFKQVSDVVSIPVVASGGAGKIEDFLDCAKINNVDAVAAASVFHYNKLTILQVKETLAKSGITVRNVFKNVHDKVNTLSNEDINNYNKFTLRHLEHHAEDEALLKTSFKNVSNKSAKEADVCIVDYGINNLKSISKAFEKIGKSVKIIDTMSDIKDAKCLVLPGIGAFADGMNEIKRKNIEEAIKQKVNNGTPLLGICLGMQLLFTESEEFGLHNGLDLVQGRVVQLRAPDKGESGYKVPHIGWNRLLIPSDNKNLNWGNTLLRDTQQNNEVYFVHSYYPLVLNPEYVIATTKYGNHEFCSVIQKGNIYGTQFHPEKSGEIGLNILREFCRINNI